MSKEDITVRLRKGMRTLEAGLPRLPSQHTALARDVLGILEEVLAEIETLRAQVTLLQAAPASSSAEVRPSGRWLRIGAREKSVEVLPSNQEAD